MNKWRFTLSLVINLLMLTSDCINNWRSLTSGCKNWQVKLTSGYGFEKRGNSGCVKLTQAIFCFSLLSCYSAVLLSGRRVVSLVFQQRVIRQSSSGFGCHGFGPQPQPPTDNRSQLFSDKNSVFRKFDEGKKALESFCRKAKYNYNESLAEKLATAENEMENVKESVL